MDTVIENRIQLTVKSVTVVFMYVGFGELLSLSIVTSELLNNILQLGAKTVATTLSNDGVAVHLKKRPEALSRIVPQFLQDD